MSTLPPEVLKLQREASELIRAQRFAEAYEVIRRAVEVEKGLSK